MNRILNHFLDFASKQDKMDIFSKCTLFNATYFEISEDEELQNNIKAIDTLLSSSNYEEIIFKYLDRNNLKRIIKKN